MIELEDFVKQISEECSTTDKVVTLKPSTAFKEIDNWSSMLALMIIVRITDQYAVILDEQDMKKQESLEDLYHLVCQMKSEQ